MSEFIRADSLSFSYEEEGDHKHPALKNVSLSVQPGEYIAVLGHNGSGKSTFAKLLNLILTPSNGRLIVDGKEITPDFSDEDAVFDIRRRVGMIFQNPDNQLVATIVEEDVAFGPENLGLPREEIRRRVDGALDAVGMREYARHAPHRLSGGQKQRIAIAGVLAMKPACMVFDESTAMLDPRGRRDVMDAIEKLNREENITILHITHYMDEAARADRVIVINDGEIYMDGTPREVFSQVDALRAAGLEVPQGTELLHALRSDGYDLPLDLIRPEECMECLVRLIQGEKAGGASV